MTRQGTREGLSPEQARHLRRIEELARTARTSGRGRLVFLAGSEGSGRSFALRCAAPALANAAPWARVVTAASASEDPRGTARKDPRIPLLESVVTKTLTLGGALISPVTAILAGLLDLSLSSERLVEAMRSREEQFESTELMDELLRRTAAEKAGSPLVCLADNADGLGGTWWTNLQFRFAERIAEDRPLILVLAVDGPVDLGDEPSEGESITCSVARSLTRRGLADWLPLAPLTLEAAMGWLGPAKQSLIAAALEISDGRAGDLARMWSSWQEQGIIERDGADRWAPTERLEEIYDDAAKGLTRRLSERLGEDDTQRSEAARLLLTCGALEGRIFTAEAVADVFRWDREGVIDLLDLLVDDEYPNRGVLEELEAIQIQDLTFESSRTLCRYRFARAADWHAARTAISNEPERAGLAIRLVDSLVEAYEPEVHAIGHTVAAICRAAGENARAAYYERNARGVSRTLRIGLATHLLTAEADDWSIWDFRDAASQLLAACVDMGGHRPPSTLLAFAEKAGEFARRANPIGKGKEADALCKEAFLYRLMGEFDVAKERLELARKLASHGAPWVLAVALDELGLVELDRGSDPAVATELIEAAEKIFRRERAPIQAAGCVYRLARIAHETGDSARARELGEKARELAEKYEERNFVGSTLHLLGDIELRGGDTELAREYALASLAIKREEGDRHDIAACMRLLASIEVTEGNYRKAWDEGTRAMEIQREQEDRNGEAVSQGLRASAALGLGEPDKARECLEEAFRIYREIGKRAHAAMIAERLREL